jgi:hypothetical protein
VPTRRDPAMVAVTERLNALPASALPGEAPFATRRRV